MDDLKWIPMPYGRRLPLGFYWLRNQDGEIWSFSVGISGYEFSHAVAHYCPIPEPTMPEPEPQDFPMNKPKSLVERWWESPLAATPFLEDLQDEWDAKDAETQRLKEGLKVSRDVTSGLVQELHLLAGWKESATRINEDLRKQVADLQKELEHTHRKLAGAQNALNMVGRGSEWKLDRLKVIAKVARDQSESCVHRIILIKNVTEDYAK